MTVQSMLTLSSDSWLRTLAPGSEVWWNDPADGFSSGYYTVTAILADNGVESEDTILCLKNDAGSEAEVYASELSALRPAAESVNLRLTLDVVYYLNGENATEMVSQLSRLCEQAIGEGMLTGESDAEVEEYSMDVVIQPDPLSEDELANFMSQRIENGDLDLEDIPVRLARYGLMEPNAFIDEMLERMAQAKT